MNPGIQHNGCTAEMHLQTRCQLCGRCLCKCFFVCVAGWSLFLVSRETSPHVRDVPKHQNSIVHAKVNALAHSVTHLHRYAGALEERGLGSSGGSSQKYAAARACPTFYPRVAHKRLATLEWPLPALTFFLRWLATGILQIVAHKR